MRHQIQLKVALAQKEATGVGGAATAVFAYLDARKGPTPTTAIVPAPLAHGGGVWLTRSF